MAIDAAKLSTESGIRIKSFREVRTALAGEYSAIFGGDIDLSPSTPDGQLVDLFAFAYTELAQTIQAIGANISTGTASGVFLDNLAAIAGIERNPGESDDSLRARIMSANFKGLATIEGMLTYLRDRIAAGVGIIENESSAIVNGLGPHSVCVVIPDSFTLDDIPASEGTWADLDKYIASKIWYCKPAGIATSGNVSAQIVDGSGQEQTIKFSRVQGSPLRLEIAVTEYSEEMMPADAAEKIRDAVVEWAAGEYTPGKDVIIQRIMTPIYTNVPGIENVAVVAEFKGVTTDSGKIAVNFAEYARLGRDDVAVTIGG